jgi:HlyD family secretion protein
LTVRTKLVISLVVAVAAAATVAKVVRGGGSSGREYRFVAVERGDLASVVAATGTLEAVRNVSVGTRVSGTISEILVDYNHRVREGQVIARIDTSLLEIAVNDASASLARTRAQAAKSARDLERARALREQGVVSETDLLDAQSQHEMDQANLRSAEVDVERAERDLAYATITAPIDGTVVERNVEVGQTVAASFSTPQLFLIANDLSRMQIVVPVDESDIGRIREGQSASFTVQAYPDDGFDGTVRQVRLASTSQDNVVSYSVVVDVGNPDGRLLPGMTATVDFLVERATDVLKVPNAALRFRPTEAMVAEVRERMRARREAAEAAGTAESGPGGGPGPGGLVAGGPSTRGERPRDRALLYCLDDAGELAAVPVRVGITDGHMTEIAGRRVEEGLQVIAGVTETEGASSWNPFAGSRESGPRRPPGAF